MALRVLHAEADGWPAEARRRLEEVAEVEAASLDRAGLLARLNGFDALIVRLGHQLDQEVFGAAGPRLRLWRAPPPGSTTSTSRRPPAMGSRCLAARRDAFPGEHSGHRRVHLGPAAGADAPAALGGRRRRPPARWRRERFRGRDLAGRRLGLVGLGRVGRKVAGFGLAFGMKVAAYDPAPGPRGRGGRAAAEPCASCCARSRRA